MNEAAVAASWQKWPERTCSHCCCHRSCLGSQSPGSVLLWLGSQWKWPETPCSIYCCCCCRFHPAEPHSMIQGSGMGTGGNDQKCPAPFTGVNVATVDQSSGSAISWLGQWDEQPIAVKTAGHFWLFPPASQLPMFASRWRKCGETACSHYDRCCLESAISQPSQRAAGVVTAAGYSGLQSYNSGYAFPHMVPGTCAFLQRGNPTQENYKQICYSLVNAAKLCPGLLNHFYFS